MNPLDLTVNQLKRAAAIKEQIEDLNKQLSGILGGSEESGTAPRKRRTISASGRRNIAAAQKARWARVQAETSPSSGRSSAPAKKRRMSRAARAKLAARMRAYWKAKKASNR